MEAVTKQKQFETVVAHAKLGKPSRLAPGGACLYRLVKDGEVRHCFVGALIPDELLSQLEEENDDDLVMGFGVTSLCTMSREVRSILASDDRWEVFLSNLQYAHDSYNPNCWRHYLRQLANQWQLQLPDNFNDGWAIEQREAA